MGTENIFYTHDSFPVPGHARVPNNPIPLQQTNTNISTKSFIE
jgi:hypothetical protein